MEKIEHPSPVQKFEHTPPSEPNARHPSWWLRRSRLEKRCFISLICVAAVAGVVLVLAIVTGSRVFSKVPTDEGMEAKNNTEGMDAKNNTEGMEAKNNTKVCSTPTCFMEASKFIRNMDFSANPCDDFYQFACGRFEKRFTPRDQPSVSTFSILSDKTTRELIHILEEPMKKNQTKPTKLAKQLYRLCMNTSQIDEFGTEHLETLIDVVGGMPVLTDAWDGSAWEWEDTIYQLRIVGYRPTYIIGFDIEPDLNDPTTRAIYLGKPSLGLDINVLSQGSENELVKAYKNYMVEILILLGAKSSSVEKEINKTLQFEIELAKAFSSPAEVSDLNKRYKKTTIGSLIEKFPAIPWWGYIRSMISFPVTLDENMPLLIENAAYFVKLAKILAKTPKRVTANYLLWRAIADIVPYLPETFREKHQKFVGTFYGITSMPNRQTECAYIVSESLEHAVAAEYIKQYVQNESKGLKVKVGDLVNRVSLEFKNSLHSTSWMDEITRKKALDKFEALDAKIGYPDELLDDAKLAKAYEAIIQTADISYYLLDFARLDEITRRRQLKTTFEVNNNFVDPETGAHTQQLEIDVEEPYFVAILDTNKHNVDLELKRLKEKVIRGDWHDFSKIFEVNAAYYPTANTIVYPARILQDEFYSDKRPNYMNYGAIGWMVGHEITHGFDNNGRHFDRNGKLEDWWSSKTKEQFITKAKCIVNQYSKYTITPSDVKINESLSIVFTTEENIADNGAAKFAYKAYQKWVSENHVELTVPGFEKYTPNQMFWISAATGWCEASRPGDQGSGVQAANENALGEIRVKGTLSNSEDFARDFNCPVGSPMNPNKKCTVW